MACPTLIVKGKGSLFIPSKEAQRICMALPGAAFKEIAGAAHMPAQENQDVFKKVIFDFLGEK